MKIVVFGAGMYVTGRNGYGAGTILASLCEISRTLPTLAVTVAALKPENGSLVTKAAGMLNNRLGTNLMINYTTVPADPTAAVAQLGTGNFDAAIVCVPDDLHYPYTKALLTSGLHVLVVKPFVTTVAQARELVDLARSKGLYGAVEYHKRFDEANLLAKELLAQGSIGDPLYATVDYSQRIVVPTEIFSSWAVRSNIFQYLSIHYVDLIWFLTGFRPLRASAVGLKEVLTTHGIDTYDSVHATTLWSKPNGGSFVGQFNTNWIDPVTTSAMSDQKYTIVGSKGRLEMDQKNRGIQLISEGQTPQSLNPYFSEFLPDSGGNLRFQGYGFVSIQTFVKDVTSLMAGSITPVQIDNKRPSFIDALPSTAVLEAVNKSLERGGEWCDIENLQT